MEAADYEVLSVREQLFHDRVRECIVSPGPGREGAGPRWEGRAEVEMGSPAARAPRTSTPAGAGAGMMSSRVESAGSLSRKQSRRVSVPRPLAPPPPLLLHPGGRSWRWVL